MPRWTEDQQAAIDARNPDLLVSAAAGSGKTAVLVERIIQLARQGAQLDRMLIVTFTRAAAAEMRERITEALARGADEGDKQMHRQLNRMDNCQISTIHGFCQRVLREHFQQVGMDPQTKLCDPALRDRLFEEAAREALIEAFEAEDENFDRLAACFEQEDILSMMKEIYEFLMSLEEPWAWLQVHSCPGPDREKAWYETLMGDLALQLEGCEPLLEEMKTYLPLLPDSFAGLLAQDELNARQLSKAAEEGPEELGRVLDALKWARAPVAKGLTSDEAQAAEAFKELRDRLKKIPAQVREKMPLSPQDAHRDQQAMGPALKGLAFAVRKLHEIFLASKEDKGVMDFNDLEHRTLQVLRDEEMCRTVAGGFDHLFVDEYQDVSRIQEAIIRRLHTEKNLLFMVGDVKQSIYRFRLADPTLFLDKQERFAKEETAPRRKLVLQKNFRSQPQVLQGVNQVFEHVMRKELTEIDYDEDARLVPGRESRDEDCLTLQIVTGGEEEEFEQVAQRIEKTLGTLLPDRKTGQMRPCRLKDIAVLLPKVKGAGTRLAQVLKDRGIPVYLEGDEEYFELPEVHTLMQVMQAVDNPCQDVPLLTVLSLPEFRFSREEQARIRLMLPNRKEPYYRAFEKACEEDSPLGDKCRRVRDTLEEWRFLSRQMPLDQWIWRVMGETGMYRRAGALPGGETRQGNLRLLCQRAAVYARSRHDGLAGFLKEGEALRSAQDRVTAKVLGEGEDLVRIMTVHKSKGLEFPVTVVAGLGHAMHQAQRSRLVLHRELGIGLSYVNPRERITRPTLSRTAIELRLKMEDKAERARLLYVAMTRAREKLILMGSVKAYPLPVWRLPPSPYGLYAAGSLLDWVCQALWKTQAFPNEKGEISPVSTAYPQAGTHWNIELGGELIHTDVEKDEDINRRLSRLREILTAPVDEAFSQRMAQARAPREPGLPLKTSVSALCRRTPWEGEEEARPEKAASRRTVAPLVMNPLPQAPGFLTLEEEKTGADRGTAVHQALACLDYTDLGDARSKALFARVAGQLDAMAQRGQLTRAQRECIPVSWLCRFLESPLGLRARQAPLIKREWAFNYRLPSLRDTLVQGVIDLCFEEEGQWVLADYKTDYYEDPLLLKERYAGQLAIYRQALEAITGKPVKETLLIGLRGGDILTIEKEASL